MMKQHTDMPEDRVATLGGAILVAVLILFVAYEYYRGTSITVLTLALGFALVYAIAHGRLNRHAAARWSKSKASRLVLPLVLPLTATLLLSAYCLWRWVSIR